MLAVAADVAAPRARQVAAKVDGSDGGSSSPTGPLAASLMDASRDPSLSGSWPPVSGARADARGDGDAYLRGDVPPRDPPLPHDSYDDYDDSCDDGLDYDERWDDGAETTGGTPPPIGQPAFAAAAAAPVPLSPPAGRWSSAEAVLARAEACAKAYESRSRAAEARAAAAEAAAAAASAEALSLRARLEALEASSQAEAEVWSQALAETQENARLRCEVALKADSYRAAEAARARVDAAEDAAETATARARAAEARAAEAEAATETLAAQVDVATRQLHAATAQVSAQATEMELALEAAAAEADAVSAATERIKEAAMSDAVVRSMALAFAASMVVSSTAARATSEEEHERGRASGGDRRATPSLGRENDHRRPRARRSPAGERSVETTSSSVMRSCVSYGTDSTGAEGSYLYEEEEYSTYEEEAYSALCDDLDDLEAAAMAYTSRTQALTHRIMLAHEADEGDNAGEQLGVRCDQDHAAEACDQQQADECEEDDAVLAADEGTGESEAKAPGEPPAEVDGHGREPVSLEIDHGLAEQHEPIVEAEQRAEEAAMDAEDGRAHEQQDQEATGTSEEQGGHAAFVSPPHPHPAAAGATRAHHPSRGACGSMLVRTDA